MDIHRESFILGMITAFAECLAHESKKAAFSPPFYPEDYPSIKDEAERIACEQGISLWYEQNRDMPSSDRVVWLVMFKFPEVLDEYRRIRQEGINPLSNLEPFHALLSYGTVWAKGAEKMIPAMRRNIRHAMPTVSRVLFGEGKRPF